MYKVVPNLITQEYSSKLSDFIKNQNIQKGDDFVPDSYSYYSLGPMNILLGMLQGRVSELVGKNLVPSYSYCRVYHKGNELKKHKDRPACEWSVTLNLSQSEPWEIFMGGASVNLGVGDACIYKGCEIEHWREPFKGEEYTQVFLHYVDVDGPNKDHMFDLSKPPNLQFKFNKPNNKMAWWRIFSIFTQDECQKIIEKFSDSVGGAFVGDGRLDDKVRRSKVTWIPKIIENEWIYVKLLQVIGDANDSFFDLDISEIIEDIQFTEYDKSYTGYYNWHADTYGVRGTESTRKLSASVQLSDPTSYDGGDLMFYEKESAPRDQGAVIVFPSYKSHKVTPVTRGKRYSLVIWVAGPPLR